MFLTLYVDAVPWFVQSSFDVQFQPGSLARLATSFSRDATVDGVDFAFITFQNSFQSLWNVWVMTRRLLMRTGLHDENVNPGCAKWGCDRNLTKEWYDFAWGDCKFMTPFNVTGAPVWRWRGNSTSLDPVQREYIYEGTGKGSYTGLV
ncbi:MAG: hypothetical protein WDW38_001721 [Sanguina aurantia]